MKNRFSKKAISILLSVIMSVSGIVPAISAFAGDGVEGFYDIQIFYKDTDMMVPSYDDDAKEKEHIEYLTEGDELKLKYELIDSVWPNNGHVEWSSSSPIVCDVTSEGVVKAFDSSKGAVIKAWLDNEVRTIPLVGNLIAKAIEKVLFNDKINLDDLDTQGIVDLVTKALGSDSIIADYVEAYQGHLIDSLRKYLDEVNTSIYCKLYGENNTVVAEDVIKVCVTKNEEIYANFLPNGTHIANKGNIKTTQAKGTNLQLTAITTPQRLGYGTVFSVKSSSVFTQGKVVATVTDGGLVYFKNVGTATIMASPDSEDVINGMLKFVNYFYKLENTGVLNNDKIADILIKYMGVDINKAVLTALLDSAFAIAKIAGGSSDPIQLTATAAKILANVILQMVYNDSITFNVIDAVPIDSFEIDNSKATQVKEGAQLQYNIINVSPDAGDTSDIVWSSSDPTVAMVDPKTGIITGLDAGGALGALSTKNVEITATSTTKNISRTVTVTVTGKTGKYISYASIEGHDDVEINGSEAFSYVIYPSRVANSDNLYITWGFETGKDDEGNPTYSWATAEEPATNGLATIDEMGNFRPQNGGVSKVAMKAVTGYYLSNGEFYEISSYIATKDVTTGIPVEKIDIKCTASASNGKIDIDNKININDKEYEYVTIRCNGAYNGEGAKLAATVYPSNTTSPNVTWVSDNPNYVVNYGANPNEITITCKAAHEVADTFNVYAVSNDGRVKSNEITVCVTKNHAKTNTINQKNIKMINGETLDVSHGLTFEGSWTGEYYACYKANWYSTDEEIFTTESNINSNGDGRITATDVGTATLYCVSADGGIVDTTTVTVYPNKQYLQEIVNLCDNSTVLQTDENILDYKDYMGKLDLAYTVLYDEDMASQTTCDTYAEELLSAFYRVGGFIGINTVEMLGTNKSKLKSEYVTVQVGSTANYKNYSYDFDYQMNPKSAMYKTIEWTSSNPAISVDKNGICRPINNSACSATITCTITDYMGNKASTNATVCFTRKRITGITISPTKVLGGKVGETKQLSATVSPSTAACKDVTWVSSDEEIATVDQNGLVTFKYGGDCVISCIANDGGIKASCQVNVITNYDTLKARINEFDEYNLNQSNYYPDSWEAYATARAEAIAMVEAKNSNQKQVDKMYDKLSDAYAGLKKYNYIQYVELYLDGEPTAEFYQYDLALLKDGIRYTNAKLDLNVRLYPNNASYLSATWESSTSDISVTSDGVASPTVNKSCYGQITCTVTDHFGNEFKDNVWVSFSRYPVTGLVLSETNINGQKGSTHQMSCTVEPVGQSITHIGKASITDYYWESDDENIATVDENGLVTFVGAGSTIIRAVSYDGGISAECKVSTEGDRSALKEALETYKDVDLTNYEVEYANRFKAAYQEAENALTNYELTQKQIDTATMNLLDAYDNLAAHPYIKVSNISLSYTTSKKATTISSSYSNVESGTVGDNDAVSINLANGSYTSNNTCNTITLNARANPTNAYYKSYSWRVDETNGMTTSIDGTRLSCTPNNKDNGGWAKATITYTDHYGRDTSRTIYITMSDKVLKSITIDEKFVDPDERVKYMYAGDSTYYLHYILRTVNSVNNNVPEFNKIFWTSSNEKVATVSSSGGVTPLDKGVTTITAKTLDGGFTSSIIISVRANYSELNRKIDEYETLISAVADKYVYTDETFSALQEAVNEAKEISALEQSSQDEIDAATQKMIDAYNALIKYEAVTGFSIGYEENANISVPNPGYIRYTENSLYGKQIQLVANLKPHNNAVYKTIEWTSSNESVTVDDFGLVTNSKLGARYSIISCKITDDFGNEFEDSIIVSFVKSGVTAVTFNEDKIYGAPQEVKQIVPNLNQGSLTYVCNDCKYESNNKLVATVDDDGNVTFISQGAATITVTSYDGGFVGHITAFTTWDTTALQAAMDEATKITYTDYAYTQGMAFKNAYDNAQAVYADVYSTQLVIDRATTALVNAMANLEGHEFIAPTAEIMTGSESVENNKAFEVDTTGKRTFTARINEDGMYKDAKWSTKDATNITASINNSQVVLTKTGDNAQITLVYTITDDYDRETEYSYTVKLVDKIVPISSFNITINDSVIESNDFSLGGFSSMYSDFAGLQLSYRPTPLNATAPISVEWKSSASNYIAVNEDGFVSLTSLAKVRRSNTAKITCTITNADGSIVTKDINITISRA